ncbi:hypothetical protein [Cellulomonas marina]|uniref:Biopolymer transporter Tol n=1 Tax=Cellulomonas marina TaxID=988821 RepID=A0A1I1ABJ6_9CELL|nr:hypothetical protein [Cellulomonas marina]GIG30391.1 hypothetical protein Cma02nite_29910 [Cellulomonas marina]SFB34882.1 hypothetical protein SAMN05421867_11655 [Cellulomonas marina]
MPDEPRPDEPRPDEPRPDEARPDEQPPRGDGPPVTPDGRYLVVRGRLWRRSDPALDEGRRAELTHELMAARRAKGAAMRAGDPAAREAARARVDAAKVALGERGPVWWDDGAPDLTQHLARTTVYAEWYAGLAPGG